ncbi:MAG: glycosyltransferase family 2 protein [Candidatus Omnitrophica bacterium]|nr:glycosyltransferase family 2 protein [Candidatus Omnitrophota bacterium]
MPSSACDIIIPIWNQPARTRRCLESVRATTQDYRLLLIDNGSEAPTRQLLDDAARADPERMQLIRNAENLGFIKAVNQGLRASAAPYVCLLNNDTVTTPGWLEEMLRVMRQDPSIGLVNPNSNTLGCAPAAATPDGIRACAASLAPARGTTREMAMTVGFCLLIRRSVLNAVGLLDERYGMGNFEDADLSLRAVAAGYRCVQALGAYVYHEEKVSFKQQPRWEAAFRDNQRLFHQRWGRPLRILWEFHQPGPLPAIDAGLFVQLLRQGHWLWYSAGRGALPEEVTRFTTAGPIAAGARWRWRCLWYVLKRRKKPVHLVASHDVALTRWLRWLRPFHAAAVLWRPTAQELEAQCRRLSHCP